jgi:hypothetical protein
VETENLSQKVRYVKTVTSKHEPFLYKRQKKFGTPRVLTVQMANAGAARMG